MAPTVPTATELDIRPLPVPLRVPAILHTLRNLATLEALDVVADADPRGLQAQLRAEAPGRYSLNCLEKGPTRWRIRIIRQRADSGCCGSCDSGI
jgi:uncharacterized protein (DUF2249 family)